MDIFSIILSKKCLRFTICIFKQKFKSFINHENKLLAQNELANFLTKKEAFY